MPQDSSEIRVYGDGEVYIAPVGTAFPALVSTAPASEWVALGFLSPAGPRFNFGVESNQIMGWQALLALRTIITGRPVTATFDLLQQNRVNWELAMGGGTTTELAGPPVNYKWVPPAGSDVYERALLIRGIDGSFIHDLGFAKVTPVSAQQFAWTRDDSANLTIELTMLDPGVGDAFYHQTNNPDFEPAA